MAYSTQTATSNGTLITLAVGIQFLDRSEITVTVDGVLDTSWTWLDANTNTIKFPAALANGKVVIVIRTTDLSELRHQFALGAAFRAQNVDENFTQVMHIAQEASEGIAAAQSAAEAAQTAAENAQGAAEDAATDTNAAITAANAANTNANSRVLRAGDTMTGPLVINAAGAFPLDVVGDTGSTARLSTPAGVDTGLVFHRGAVDVATVWGSFDGLLLNGSQVVRLAVGGAEMARLSSVGLGVGTTAPARGLHLAGGTGSAAPSVRLERTGIRTWSMGLSDTGTWSLDDNTVGLTRVRISTGGTVQINATAGSEQGRLQVNGDVVLGSGAGERGNKLWLYQISASNGAYLSTLSGGGATMNVGTTAIVEAMRWEPLGNVGINAAPTDYTGAGYRSLAINHTTGGIFEFQAGGVQQARVTGWSNSLAIHTNNVEALRVDSAQRLLVGKNTTLGYKVDVLGQIGVEDGTIRAGWGAGMFTGGTMGFGTTSSHDLSIGTNAVTRQTFKASGHIHTVLSAEAPTLTVNSTMSVHLVSDTQLRFSVRGSDGTTRTATLTLA